VVRQEEVTSRSKLAVLGGLLDGELTADRQISDMLSRCLLCGRCADNCPSSVASTPAIRAGRELVAQEVGLPLVKRLVLEKALTEPSRLDSLVRAGRLAQPLAHQALPLLSGLHLRLADTAQALPPLAPSSFLSQAPREVAGPKGAPRLGLFVGCVANYLNPDLARHALELLSRVATVVIPPDQGCCGLPALAAGLGQAARSLARRNLAAFRQANVQGVVTFCGSCAHTLAQQAPELVDEEDPLPLGTGVREISQILVEHPQVLKDLGRSAGPVALHHPCHLVVGLKVTEEPRAMLAAAGVELVDMAGADQCCGGGGLFAVNQPELSQAIFAPRREAFQDSGASVLATSCSGCAMQWSQGLGGAANVVHPINLLK
jgi:glycolate oxidase iron-sulfur subunit